MPNWSESMQQTFEYYIVDPRTWKDKSQLRTVSSCTIERDLETDTLGSATIDISESTGECYIRVYLITIQNGVTEKHPLGTFLVQTPATDFNGKRMNVSMDAYTPLMELKENSPEIGYFVPKKDSENKETNIMDYAYTLTKANLRAPVISATSPATLYNDFVADTSDTWCSYIQALIANANYTFALDELGRVLFAPNQDISSLQPVYTYTDDNSSILYPEVTLDRDMYGIPNVVEVIYSSGTDYFHVRVVNDNENSPISTVNRGREILYRDTQPSIAGTPTKEQIEEYAEKLLKALSALEYTVKYTHGYCPVRIGDCVRLNYPKAGLNDVKAKVISQSIKCQPGCPVTEKAVFTTNLWR